MFTHLHVHTEYSLLDGMCRIPQLIARVKELGMDSVAITDHGVLHGVNDFYLVARREGIKPIVGCEVYVAPSGRYNKNSAAQNFHLTLLARNEEGYHNLIELCTKAHLEGFYYKPRVDKELLIQHHGGLIALSGCIRGEVGRFILEGRLPEAREAASWYRDVFGDYYLELMRHPISELERINPQLISLGEELGIPLVATNDVHYIDKGDAFSQGLLLCIQTNSSINDEKRMKMPSDTFYLRSPEEMEALFSDLPQALENTERIAQMCDLNLEFGRLHLPQTEIPGSETSDEYLAELCWQGLKQRYPHPTPDMEQRLRYELDVIFKTQFSDYFLVVWDLASFAREHDILFGVRGSAAASFVLYCLGITDIDPLGHGLIFERFLNVERKEMPDIDLDFQDDRRDEVISHLVQKYGNDHVAQIITFGTLGARAAIKDVGRALGMPYGDVDRVARLIPLGPHVTLSEAIEENSELRAIYHQDEIVRHLIDYARGVEGIARHASTHAAGIVISREPLTKHVPLQQASREGVEGMAMTQWGMESVAAVGLLKMDLLGLANLTTLKKATGMISQTCGTDIDLHGIPLDDSKTFELLASSETSGVFQMEGAGMRRYIKELKPSCFSDVAAMIALYRPGPMQHIPTFISAKHGVEPVQYPHPILSPILEETYGVIVYQDQVLLIVQALAGYSLAEADIVRKAMGKKIPEVMKKERQRFIAGAKIKGFSREVAEKVFALIEPFAGYAFNKAHSVSYAMIAYQTAYLKAHYPVEYMTALLTANAGQSEKVASTIAECRRMNIPVLPPDINRSGVTFTIEGNGHSAIRFGLADIKNVGYAAVAPLLASREKQGVFSSIEDFCRRADLGSMNKRALESLIKTGTMDSLGTRGALLSNVDRILSLSHQEQRLREMGQASMFDLWGRSVPIPMPSLEMADEEVSSRQKLAWEKELLGVYLSEHPFSRAASQLAASVTTFCGQIDSEMVGQRVVVAGAITSVRQLLTKSGQHFVTAVFEDLDGSIEVTAWSNVFQRTQELWSEGNVLLIRGRVRARDGQVQLVCDEVQQYQPTASTSEEESLSPVQGNGVEGKSKLRPGSAPTGRCKLSLHIAETEDEREDVERFNQLATVLREFEGEDVVYLIVEGKHGVVRLEMPELGIRWCPELRQRLIDFIGEEALEVDEAEITAMP